MGETGDKLNAAYRALVREEPSAAMDAAILSASRQALARPSASRRWAAPISIAAVLVLAFGVTLNMQREQPGLESPDNYRPPASAAVEEPKPTAPADKLKQVAPATQVDRAQPLQKPLPQKKNSAVGAKQDFTPAPPPQAKLQMAPAEPAAAQEEVRQQRDERHDAERKDLAKESNVGSSAVAAAPPAQPAARVQPSAPMAESRMKREAFAARAPAAAGAMADAQSVADEPSRELEAIAKLRTEGRNEEADKALAEFRKKRPDYRIPDAMWERVKPR